MPVVSFVVFAFFLVVFLFVVFFAFFVSGIATVSGVICSTTVIGSLTSCISSGKRTDFGRILTLMPIMPVLSFAVEIALRTPSIDMLPHFLRYPR